MPEPYLLEKQLRADLAPISRRGFLKKTVWVSAGVVAVAAGGFAILHRSEKDKTALPADIHALNLQEYLLFSRLVQVMLPTQGSTLIDPAQISLVKHIDYLLGNLRPDIRQQLGMGLALFDNAAILSGGRWGRFIDLPDAEATAYLDRWVNSKRVPQRAIASAAMRLVKAGYWADPATWPGVDFEGPVSKKWGMVPQGNSPLPA